MSIVQQVKEVIGIESNDHQYRYRCESCGATFESDQEPDSYWLSCRECDAEELEVVEGS